MSTRPCLRLGTNLAPRVAFWDRDLGPILGPVLDFIFVHHFWVPTIKNKIRGPKMVPKNGTQNWPQKWTQIRIPKCNPGRQGRSKQGCAVMIFIQ